MYVKSRRLLAFVIHFPGAISSKYLIGEKSNSHLEHGANYEDFNPVACAGLISTITHENIEYNIVNALTDLHGVDGPLHNFVSDNAVRIGHTNIANDSPRKVGFYTNLPGSTYVLWLDPGEKGTLHFNKDYPWVLASGEPRANLNKEIYEILVPQS
ncbi:hypothetical protein MJO29_007332 [Puccinia striiformis f. sp. tritici]|nr:hypothetical protein MJO29_007332 [Puccinia striiformis f. sp. tritici]